MRILLLSIVSAIAVFLSNSASAELIIYRGTLKENFVGQGLVRQISYRYYLIVDHDTTNIAEIPYTTINGTKIFHTATRTNHHFVEISGPKGKNLQAIAHSPSDCDISEGFTSDGVFAEGASSLLAVNTNSTISFPKVLAGGGRGISHSSGQPVFIQSTLVLGFDQAETLTSNGNGETLDAALERLSANLQSQGYNLTSEKKKDSARAGEFIGFDP